MPKKTPTEPKTPRAPRQQSPEIAQAKQACADRRADTETACREIMKEARSAARFRKMMDGLTDKQKSALKAVL